MYYILEFLHSIENLPNASLLTLKVKRHSCKKKNQRQNFHYEIDSATKKYKNYNLLPMLIFKIFQLTEN